MSAGTAVRGNDRHIGSGHPWPSKRGSVAKAPIRELPISIDPDVLVFFLGDLVGRKLRVVQGPMPMHADSRDLDPGRVTILTDGEGNIVDMWVDRDARQG
jgi:hypothetical protein